MQNLKWWRFLSRGLTVTVLLVIIFPAAARAQRVDSLSPEALQQTIQLLERQLVALKQELAARLARGAQAPGALTTISTSCLNLTRDLALGARDTGPNGEVLRLQSFLRDTGDYFYPGLTGYFGEQTQTAVQSFQRREGIVSFGRPETTGYGAVGQTTSARIRALGCGEDNVAPTSPSITPPISNTYTITTLVSPAGSGTIGRSIGGTTNFGPYAPGAVVTLAANQDEGYTFTGWSGNCLGIGVTCVLIMNGNKNITANFTAVASTAVPHTFRLRTIDNSTSVSVASAAISLTAAGQLHSLGPTDANGYSSTLTLPEGATYSGSITKSGYQNRSFGFQTVTSAYGSSYVLTVDLTPLSLVAPVLSTLTITGPTASTVWRSDVAHTVTWSSTGFTASAPANIQIYTANGSLYRNYNTGITVNNRSFTLPANTFTTAGAYYLNINAGAVSRRSDTFTVTTPTSPPATTYRIVASASTGGTISPAGGFNVNAGASRTFIITPSIGYRLSNVYVNGVTVGGISSTGYTFSNVQANQTIDARFVVNEAAPTAPPPPPPAQPPTLAVSSPPTNSQWTVGNGPVIQWSSSTIPAGNLILVELLTPSAGAVPGFSNFSTANDGSQSGNLTNSVVSSGWYYFRLSTHVNGQPIYGGSGIFQFTGASQPPPTTSDLIISAPATLTVSPTSVVAGQAVTLPGWIGKNQGNAAASAFTIGFYLSSDVIIDVNDTYITGASALNGLAAGATFSAGGPTLIIPANIPAGSYYIGILMDRQNVITESDESNNYKSAVLRVTR